MRPEDYSKLRLRAHRLKYLDKPLEERVPYLRSRLPDTHTMADLNAFYVIEHLTPGTAEYASFRAKYLLPYSGWTVADGSVPTTIEEMLTNPHWDHYIAAAKSTANTMCLITPPDRRLLSLRHAAGVGGYEDRGYIEELLASPIATILLQYMNTILGEAGLVRRIGRGKNRELWNAYVKPEVCHPFDTAVRHYRQSRVINTFANSIPDFISLRKLVLEKDLAPGWCKNKEAAQQVIFGILYAKHPTWFRVVENTDRYELVEIEPIIDPATTPAALCYNAVLDILKTYPPTILYTALTTALTTYHNDLVPKG